MASKTIKGLTIEIGGDTTKLGQAISSMEKEAGKASKELSDINKVLKLMPNSEELLLQKQKTLAKEIGATSEKLDVLKEAEKQVQKQFEEGKVSEEQIQALQREILVTTNTLEGYQKAAEETAKALEEAGHASGDATEGARQVASASDDAAKSEKTLTEKITDQKTELTKLKEQYVEAYLQYGKNSDEARKLESQIKDLSGEIAGNEKAVKAASDAADEADKSLDDMGDSAREAGGGLSTAAVAAGEFIGNLALDVLKEAVSALKEIGQNILETGMGFESSMSKVGAIAGEVAESDLPAITKAAEKMHLSYQQGADATETAMNILEAKARKMGETTQFSAQEAADAMSYMAMAGWKTEDMLKGIDGVMNLAAASGEELAITSDIVTDAMTALGMETEQAADFADILTAASTNANTNVSMLGESFKYCASLAGAMDASAEDLALGLGLMANSGIKGSQAGNNLKNALTNLVRPMKAQAVAMQELGLVATETVNVIDNAKVDKALTNVEKKTLDMQKAQLAYNDAVAKYGEASSQAQTKLLNLEKAENNLTAAQNALTKAQEGTTKTIQGQSKFVDDAGNMKSLGEIYDVLRESLGKINVELTDADGNIKEYETLIEELEQSEEGLTQAEQIKNAAILFGKQNLSGMLAIVNASADDYEKLKTALYNCGGAAEETARKMNDNLAGDLKILNSAWQEFEITIYESANAPLRDLVQLVTNEVMPALTGLFNGTEGADKALGDALGNVVKTALKQFNDALPAIANIGGTLILTLSQSLMDAAPELLTTFFNIADELADSLGTALPELTEKLAENLVKIAAILAERVPQLIAKLGAALIASVPAIVEAGFTLLSGLLQAFPELVQNLVPVVSGLVLSLVEMLVSHMSEFLEGSVQLLLALCDAFVPLIEALVPLVPELITSLVDMLLDNSDTLLEGAGKLFYMLVSAMMKTNQKLIEVLAAMLVNVLNELRKLYPKLTKLMDRVLDIIFQPLRDIKQRMITSGHNIIAGLLQGIEESATWLYKAVTSLANTIIEKITKPFEISSPSKKMKWVGEMIDEGLAEGISDSADKPEQQMKKMSAGLLKEAEPQEIAAPVRMAQLASRLLTETAPLPQQIEAQSTSAIPVQPVYAAPELYERLDALLNAVRDGKILAIDGEKLVGATIDRIDAQLGIRQEQAQRGEFYDVSPGY